MEPESVSRQQSTLPAPVSLGGALASGEGALDEGDGDGDDPMPALPARLIFCIAWLFGLEAFLAESDGRAGLPRS
ncbi:hypothetical protein [Paraburkholderia lycopersici]|uniref:Uncharacterized protein n=1 Tax=Paraburkholderia lycopersici TaxID=416944 RepID=A0A1G6M8Z5_9BURK|nr:hypothetical protein [Paraburkholderia lycopersici]SDC51456.1 hypothetical protein SAMN05421548_107152 [Paraburkholderia lycopersici]